jgi:hypothetical protein
MMADKKSMDEKTLEALRVLLDYLEPDERRYWQESGCPRRGPCLYLCIQKVRKWLG